VLNGELWAAQAYSGDVIAKIKNRTDIKCVFPKEGYNIWMDKITISIDSAHKDEAHKFINFLLEPKNAARTANMFAYPTTIEADVFLNEDNKDNFKKYFSEETLRKGEFVSDIGEAEAVYNKIFNFLKLKEIKEE
jgi:spermidine/putrescine transport system substrate-binding protein